MFSFRSFMVSNLMFKSLIWFEVIFNNKVISGKTIYIVIDGWNGGVAVRSKRKGIYAYINLIYVVVQQKPTQHCKAIILQRKIK